MSEEQTEKMTIVAALNSALDVALGLDERVIMMGEDIADPIGGVMKATKGLSTKYGEDRVRATPIVEQTIVGSAVGAAMGGYRPVAEIMFMDFLCQAMDQIINHAAKSRFMSGGHTTVPLVVRAMVGSSNFGAQHSQALEAWFMHTPGLKVVMPSNPYDTKGLLLSSIFDDDPVIFIENMAMSYSVPGMVPTGDYRIPLGEAAVLQEGEDVTVITYGAEVHTVMAAAESLVDEMSVEVIDLRTLVPLDLTTCLESVTKTRRAIVVHGSTQFCGPGAEIATLITDELFGALDVPVARLGGTYTPIAFAKELESLPTEDKVVAALRELVERPSVARQR